MRETQISTRTDDRSSVVASFFLGIAAALLCAAYWIFFHNVLIVLLLCFATLIIFLTITLLLTQARTVKKIVRVQNAQQNIRQLNSPQKTPDFIGSTQTKTYHKSDCGLARRIAQGLRIESNDIAAFRGYKACRRCRPNK